MKATERSVLLTGASGGLGHAIARALAAAGAELALSGRRADVLEPLGDELSARVLAVDLAERAAPAALAEWAGDVDVLVANAALPASGVLDDYTPEQVDRALDVNLRAPIQLVRAVMPGMIARRRGALVFVSSIAGKATTPGQALYSATKFGLRGFALALREDLRGSGVSVSSIFPGFIRGAGMFADAGVALPRGVGTRAPEDVAAAVLRAIERGPAEIDVAPLSMRLGAKFGGMAPATANRVARRMGSEDLARRFAAAQRIKR
ncbi:MAG: SDR family NAD(P)-dependent oxidoreductase [Solirubrobacteraceae bacterium]|nr:MAG: oxidoreductase [Solirubrobacterales bacterium]